MNHINRVLVVDDSVSIQNLISAHVQSISDIEIVFASSYAETETLLEKSPTFLCAVLDLTLPDAPNGEIVDLVQKQEIPVLILTGSIDSAIKQTMDVSLVIDYIVKRNPNDIKYLATAVNNIYNNQHVKVLVVDDSISLRSYVVGLLKNLRYTTYEACDGVEALNVIKEHDDISLVITDYNMPNMDGLRLIEEIRKSYRREEMAVLGLSSQDDNELTVKLLKTGANDYMTKPFIVSEFYCRVQQNATMIGYVKKMNEVATRDYLTGVRNRRSLYELGEVMYANAKRDSVNLALAMIDADKFKNINDTYGHDTGDEVLSRIAKTLDDQLRGGDIVARFGGEEFVCITVLKNIEDAALVFERIREAIENIDIEFEGEKITISASIGVTTNLSSSFGEMITLADGAMFEAKESGRNRVVLV